MHCVCGDTGKKAALRQTITQMEVEISENKKQEKQLRKARSPQAKNVKALISEQMAIKNGEKRKLKRYVIKKLRALTKEEDREMTEEADKSLAEWYELEMSLITAKEIAAVKEKARLTMVKAKEKSLRKSKKLIRMEETQKETNKLKLGTSAGLSISRGLWAPPCAADDMLCLLHSLTRPPGSIYSRAQTWTRSA